MNLKLHNPDKLGPTDIGDDEGYRLLLVTETRQDATHWWDGEMWVKMKRESYDQSSELYDSVTYRTDKPLPILGLKGSKVVWDKPKGELAAELHVPADKNSLHTKPIAPTPEEPVVVPLDGGKGGHMVYEGDKTMYVPAPPDTQDKADAVLNERAQSYGKFIDNARIARSLKAVVAGALLDRQDTIPDDMAEALDVILSKIARIVSGTEKGWHDQLLDIEGYARLVRERIEGNPR